MKSGLLEFETDIYGADDIFDTKICARWENKCRKLERNRVGADNVKGLGFELSIKVTGENKVAVSYDNLPEQFHGKKVNQDCLFDLIRECISYAYSMAVGFSVPGYIEQADDFAHYASIFHSRGKENIEAMLGVLCQCGLDAFVMTLLQFERIIKLCYELDQISFTHDTYQWVMSNCGQFWDGYTWTGGECCYYFCDRNIWPILLDGCFCDGQIQFTEAAKLLVKGCSRIREVKFILRKLQFDAKNKCWSLPDGVFWNGRCFEGKPVNGMLAENELWKELLGMVKDEAFISPIDEAAYRI